MFGWSLVRTSDLRKIIDEETAITKELRETKLFLAESQRKLAQTESDLEEMTETMKQVQDQCYPILSILFTLYERRRAKLGITRYLNDLEHLVEEARAGFNEGLIER